MDTYVVNKFSDIQKDMVISILCNLQSVSINTKNLPSNRVDFEITFANYKKSFIFIKNINTYSIICGCVLAFSDMIDTCMARFLCYLKDKIAQDYNTDLEIFTENKEVITL